MKSPYSELPRTGSFILSSIDPSVASRGTPQGARPRHLCFQGSLPGSIVRTCSWRSHLCRNWLRQPRRPRGGRFSHCAPISLRLLCSASGVLPSPGPQRVPSRRKGDFSIFASPNDLVIELDASPRRA
jgi:hypothetical protein